MVSGVLVVVRMVLCAAVVKLVLVVAALGGAGVGWRLGWGREGITCVGLVDDRISMHTRMSIYYKLIPTPRGGLLSRLALTVAWDSSTSL